MTKFNINDKVVALARNGYVKEGAIGVVKGFSNTFDAKVVFNNRESYWINIDFLKLHEPQPRQKWYPVPGYGGARSKIVDAKGEEVGDFEMLEEAEEICRLWNREVES